MHTKVFKSKLEEVHADVALQRRRGSLRHNTSPVGRGFDRQEPGRGIARTTQISPMISKHEPRKNLSSQQGSAGHWW